jgi:hypothetical protein
LRKYGATGAPWRQNRDIFIMEAIVAEAVVVKSERGFLILLDEVYFSHRCALGARWSSLGGGGGGFLGPDCVVTLE